MPRTYETISPGQRAALVLAANGYTSKQIATRLGTTEQAIHLRLKAAAYTLGARSRPHAVALAIRQGIITTEDIKPPTGPTRVGKAA